MAANPQSALAVPDTGRVYRFGTGLDGNAVLKRGWGAPEEGFVWSEGKAALVVLPALPGKNMLAISMWGYVPASTADQEVLLFVNGSMKGYFEVHEKTILRVSHDNTAGTENLELTFYVPSATSPRQAEGSSDDRRLGVALATIQLSGETPQA